MFVRQALMRSCLLLIASIGIGSDIRAAEPLAAFLTKHCISCHGPENEEGELRIDLLSRDFELGGEAHRWAELIERVNSGEMPPEDEPQPTQDEIATFVTKLDSLIREGRAARMAAWPPVAHYRLSRKEYQNTVYDLLGVRYDPTQPGELNEDTLWHGYERIGLELSLSPSHIERYYRAADIVLDRVFPATPSKARKVRKTAAELRYRIDSGGKKQQEWLERFGIKRPLRYLMVFDTPHTNESIDLALSPDWFGKNSTPQSGLYRVRLQAKGILPSPDNRFLYIPYVKDNNAIFQYHFDPDTGSLKPMEPLNAQPPAGTGPRHIVYHPALPVVYFSNEQHLGVSVYDRDTESGQLKFRSVCEAVTADEPKEGISSSDIVITPDGRFLFAGIRGHGRDFDWITRYRIDENGDLSLIGRTPADKIPWGFTLSPHGEYLFVTASQGATITAYKIGKEGSLDKVASIPCDQGITDIVAR